jgi:rhodanese-related sulfurtransferase
VSLPHISPSDAKALIDRGAIMIDIRDINEHARERIAQAMNMPLPKLSGSSVGKEQTAVVFHCKTGHRTTMNTAILAKAAKAEAFILDGGIEAWKRAGLPVVQDRKLPIEMNRQVHIAAGGLVLLGAIAGYAVSPGFHALSGAAGAGLMFAGFSGTCTLAHLLKFMPWNRVTA